MIAMSLIATVSGAIWSVFAGIVSMLKAGNAYEQRRALRSAQNVDLPSRRRCDRQFDLEFSMAALMVFGPIFTLFLIHSWMFFF